MNFKHRLITVFLIAFGLSVTLYGCSGQSNQNIGKVKQNTGVSHPVWSKNANIYFSSALTGMSTDLYPIYENLSVSWADGTVSE